MRIARILQDPPEYGNPVRIWVEFLCLIFIFIFYFYVGKQKQKISSVLVSGLSSSGDEKYAAFELDPLACFFHCRSYQSTYWISKLSSFLRFFSSVLPLLLGKSSFRVFNTTQLSALCFCVTCTTGNPVTLTKRLVTRKSRLFSKSWDHRLFSLGLWFWLGNLWSQKEGGMF